MNDTLQSLITIVVALVGSTGLFTLITFLINRHDKKIDKKNGLEAKVDALLQDRLEDKRDLTRTQLLVLIASYPDHEDEIIKVARKYFVDLEGNWIMESIFQKYCEDRDITIPSWYHKK